jgi:hypothetical protein
MSPPRAGIAAARYFQRSTAQADALSRDNCQFFTTTAASHFWPFWSIVA